jgi:succinate dehydrogenase / fumarate reductase membrane anchor subunit
MPTKRTRPLLSSAQGLGSAREGFKSWWTERVAAVALVPLTLWFTGSLIALGRADYTTFVHWIRTPFAALSMVVLLIALFSHLTLGLQVVIEDYVHSWAKIPALLVARFSCVVLGIAGILATLRITLNG